MNSLLLQRRSTAWRMVLPILATAAVIATPLQAFGFQDLAMDGSFATTGGTMTTTISKNAMSSRSSSVQQSDGSRDDTREVRLGNEAWSVTVSSIDRYMPDRVHSTHALSFGILDQAGRHRLTPGQTYTAPDGTRFAAKPDSIHIVQTSASGQQVTDIQRELNGTFGSKLNVVQHECQGDHC